MESNRDENNVIINKIVEKLAGKFAEDFLSWLVKSKPFGIVHDAAPIKLNGKYGLLVWDYVIWNELTFVDEETKEKRSLFNNMSDEATKAKFAEYVLKYGI